MPALRRYRAAVRRRWRGVRGRVDRPAFRVGVVIGLVLVVVASIPVGAVYALPMIARAGGPVGWALDTMLDVPDVTEPFRPAQRTLLNPVADPAAARQRRDVVLGQMEAAGFITAEQRREAQQTGVPREAAGPPPPPRFPFFASYVKDQLLQEPVLGDTREERAEALYSGGLRIHTTSIPHMQDAADTAIADHLGDPAASPMGGLASLDPRSGAIRAMAVGPDGFGPCEEDDCTTTTVNPIVPGRGGSGRQAGSAFKPIVAAAALADGIGTDWHTSARPRPVPGCEVAGEEWAPGNYTASADRRGTIDMARVFGTFANGGITCRPIAVTSVETADGEVLFEQPPTCERVIGEDVAARVNAMLERVVRDGTGTGAQLARSMAGKTGTTDDWRDAWFVGYVPQLVTASWVGYEQPRSMTDVLGFEHVAGGTVPAAIWQSMMIPAMEPTEPAELLTGDLDRYRPPPPPPSDEDRDRDDQDREDRDGRDNGRGHGPDRDD